MATLSFGKLILLAFLTALATGIFNIIFHSLKNNFDWSKETKDFKRKYYYDQLKELYIPLYAIVAQSEFLRRFMGFDDRPYDEMPFIEVKKTKKKAVIDIQAGVIRGEEVSFSDSITEFNKEKLANLIIDKGVFASQELLKLAVAYRYIHQHYTDETIVKTQLEQYQVQELDLINRMVRLIVKETNEKLKECNMPYNNDEIDLSTMLVDYNVNVEESNQENN
jgi:hypothetical protein